MSKMNTKSQNFEVIAESAHEIDPLCIWIHYPNGFASKRIQFKEYPHALWTLKVTRASSRNNYPLFDFEIAEFPEELKKDCFLKFSCSMTHFDETIPYSSKLGFGTYAKHLCGNVKSFTVKLAVLKNRETSSADILSRKQLLGNISSMYGDESLSDFTFIVKGKPFKVHKFILAASSPMMRKMFTADYQEKRNGECKIDDIEPNIFESFIRFMYSCTVPKDLGDAAYELYAAAHYYEVDQLKDICLKEIQKNLTAGNAVEAHALAFQYDLKELLTDAWKIVKRDILKIQLPDTVKPLSPGEIAEIMALRETGQAIYNKYTEVLPQ